MNQILYQKDEEQVIDEIDEIPEFTESKSKVRFGVLTIIFVTVITMCSLKLFSLATNDSPKDNQEVAQINQEENENIIENNLNENIIINITENNTDILVQNEVKEKETQQENTVQNEVKQASKALAQINTKNRKTSSGKSYTSIGLIRIPSLNIKYQILSKTSEELLKISVNKYWGCNPNEVGNMCIVGHNYKDSRFFGKLPKIKKGAKIYITDLKGKTLTYKVYDTDVIKEDDLSCTSQKTNGRVEITLITCYYEPGHKHATKRFIAKARAE